LRNQQIGQQGGQFGVFAPLYQAGLKFGDVASQAAMQGLFPQQMDPALQQASAIQSVLGKYQGEDLSSPETLSKIGRELMQVAPDAGLKAMAIAKELRPERVKPVALSRGQQLVNPETGEVVAEGLPEEQGKVLTPAEARAQGLPEGGVYQQRPDGTISTIQAPRAPKEFTSGDVSAFTGRVESVTKPIKNTLTDLSTARSFASQAKAGNAKANAQLDRFLAKASGDSQLSQVEVVTVANAGSFPERVVNAVNKFFTGTPTEMSIQEKEDVLNVIEIVYNRRYADERQSLTTSFAGYVPERVLNANLPAIPLSKPAQEYMQRGVKQAAGQAAATPLSPNAARYLTQQPPRASEVPPMSSTLVPPIR
jgi:hypothetical protein